MQTIFDMAAIAFGLATGYVARRLYDSGRPRLAMIALAMLALPLFLLLARAIIQLAQE